MKRIAVVIITNKEGKLFVHQRRSDKKTFPDLYGLGAGGHIEEGETPEVGATRELFEETGLQTPIKKLFSIEYKGSEEAYPVEVFETITDESPRHMESEWQWSGWMTTEEIDELLQKHKLCSDTAIFYQKYVANKQ
jgi:8-oxo-dGTP pyrophosphatase MutT (NUDIX family)